jgi:hypothetical protein
MALIPKPTILTAPLNTKTTPRLSKARLATLARPAAPHPVRPAEQAITATANALQATPKTIARRSNTTSPP